MTLEILSQKKAAFLGLLQSVLALSYIAILACFFQLLERADFEPPEILAAIVMMTLFVISATVMGIIVLGVPIYLVRKDNWSKALRILAFTLLYSFILIAVLLALIFVVMA